MSSQLYTVTVTTITSLGKYEKRIMSDIPMDHVELILRTEGIGLEEDTYLNIDFRPQLTCAATGAQFVAPTRRRR